MTASATPLARDRRCPAARPPLGSSGARRARGRRAGRGSARGRTPRVSRWTTRRRSAVPGVLWLDARAHRSPRKAAGGERVRREVQHVDVVEPSVVHDGQVEGGAAVGEHRALAVGSDEHDDGAGAAAGGASLDANVDTGRAECCGQTLAAARRLPPGRRSGRGAVRGAERSDVRRASSATAKDRASTSVPTPGGPESQTTTSSTRSPTAQSTPGP